MTVTEAQRQQFADDGYFITDVAFDAATLAGVRAEFQKCWDDEIAEADKTGDAHKQFWARNRPHLAALNHRGAACREFCHHPVFGDLCRQLLGDDVDLTWNQAILKAPQATGTADNRQNALGWHQDIWYGLNSNYLKDVHEDQYRAPDNAITCWVAITRTIVDNGTLWVLPGRHKEGLFPHVWDADRIEYQAQIDTAYRIPVVLRPGQVLVFKKYLPHSSGFNVSSEVRMAYQIGYNQVGLFRGPAHNVSPMLRGGKRV